MATKTASKPKGKPVEDEIEDEELDLDDDMPDDDDDSDSSEEDDDGAMPDVVVTQPTAIAEPVSLETASVLMDLIERVEIDAGNMTILEAINLGLDEGRDGTAVFWQGRQVAAILKQDDGLFTVWKLRGSVPGKAIEDVDGAEGFEVRPSKARLDFPISWHAIGNGCFKAKVLAFEGQADFGTDFAISTDVDQNAVVTVTTDPATQFESAEFAHYGKAASWTGAVAEWFVKTRQTSGSDSDDE